MKNIIESIRKQYPVSDLTIKELESYLTPCSFPKKYQLIKEGIYCKYAYFIEKGILTYIIHSGFISGYQNRYGDNLKPPTNVYHRMTA